MKIFNSFENKKIVYKTGTGNEELVDFQTLKKNIEDTINVDDKTAARELSEFMNKEGNQNEIDEAVDLFIKLRPEAEFSKNLLNYVAA